MANYEHVLLTKDAAIATITLNRPEAMNAMSSKLQRELRSAVLEADADPSVNVLVITGNGRAFCAGRDLKEYNNYTLTPIEDWQRRADSGAFSYIKNLHKPVIAAVNGHALAGGCELALSCDIRIAGESATFGVPEIDRGVWPGAGATYLLPRLMGLGQALELMLSGKRIDAREAERIGMVNRTVADDKLMEEVHALASEIASKSPLAIKLLKAAVYIGLNADERTTIIATAALRALNDTTTDRVEGVRAFVEKRKATFKGK